MASVIPAMDKLDNMLATAIITKDSGDVTLSAPIKAALLVAKNTLNRYYNLTDASELYRIAIGMFLFVVAYLFTDARLVMHPRYKFGYFKDQGWLPEWKTDAKRLVLRTFAKYEEEYERDRVEIIEETNTKPKVSNSLPVISSSNYL